MQLPPHLVEKVERDYLNLLIAYLQSGEITAGNAKLVTREFLTMTPFLTEEDLEQKILEFTQKHPLFGGLYIDLLRFETESDSSETVIEMQRLIKENKLDDAIMLGQTV